MIMIKSVKFKSDEVSKLASITTRRDRLGNVFYYVEFYHSCDVGTIGFRCDNLSSCIDIIKNNLA